MINPYEYTVLPDSQSMALLLRAFADDLASDGQYEFGSSTFTANTLPDGSMLFEHVIRVAAIIPADLVP